MKSNDDRRGIYTVGIELVYADHELCRDLSLA